MPDYDLTFSEGTCYQNSKHDISKYRPVPMPSRNTTADDVARAADKCLRFTAGKYFPMVELGDLADIVSGGTPDTSNDKFWDGDIVWVTPKDLGRPHNIYIDNSERKITSEGLSSSSAKLLPIGTVLLSSRAPIGHLAISKVPLSTNQGFKNIICSQKLDNRYLFHILRASIEELQNLGRGNTFKEIPARLVSQLKIPIPPLNVQTAIAEFLDAVYLRVSGYTADLPLLPPPLSEQRRIVARIEELASRIEEARRLREEAKVNTEHLVASAVSRKLKHLAERFPLVPLLDICDFQGGSQPPKSMFRNEPAPGYVRFLQIRDFSSDSYLTYIPVSTTNRIAKPDDVLVGRYGASLGKILRGKEGAYNVAICKAIPRLEELSLDFLSIALEFGPFQERLRTIGRSAQAGFNKGDLKGVEYPLPPLDEQYRVVEYVQQLQNGIRRLQYYQSDTSKLIESLLPSILDKAFKGEL